jgi:hypothetical protein
MARRPNRFAFSAKNERGEPCTLFVCSQSIGQDFAEGHVESDPVNGSITTDMGEELAREGRGADRSASGMLFTSDDPEAP